MFAKINNLKPHLTISNGVLLLALVITLSWAWGTIVAIQNNAVLQQQVDALAQENSLYSLQNDTLKYQQAYYNTDEYLDLSARQRLDKASPGEKVLILPSQTSN